MFARKKPHDFQASLQKFTDLSRDSTSRTKHLQNIFENLNAQEKKQLIEGFNFEIYHLIEVLMISHYEMPIDQLIIADVESALGILEQVLLYAPELIGKGWQRNGIEFLLKMVLNPKNVITVRKLAIRLFIIWYQSLAVFGHTSQRLDAIFQCCIPYFPLHNGQSTEDILTSICENQVPSLVNNSNGYGNGFEPCLAKSVPIVMCTSAGTEQEQSNNLQPNAGKTSVRERAQTLQIYLDKFLEYTTRETVKICWSDSTKRTDCVRFLLDRIMVLYIYELFPDAEANGIDVYDGWEGTFEDDCDGDYVQLMDTSDPLVIAKYWLIRWITNIAFESPANNQQSSTQISARNANNTYALQLFKQSLFASRKATNILLTLMREAFRLPLSCNNVIQKVLQLLRHWLLQQEIPSFVQSKQVSLEAWNMLLLHMLFSFFRSPYLLSTGDKLPSAISITHTILQIVRDLANPSCATTVQQQSLSKDIWQKLLDELLAACELSTTRSDAFGQATSAGFSRTLLSVLIFVRVIREVDIEDAVWDQVHAIFRGAVWTTQVTEQWARIVLNQTRALILNLFSIEVNVQKRSDLEESAPSHPMPSQSAETCSNGSRGCQPSSRTSDSGSTGIPCTANSAFLGDAGMDEDERLASATNSTAGDSTAEFRGVIQTPTTLATWLRAWMRVLCLVDASTSPADKRHTQLAVQTYGRAMDMLAPIGPMAAGLCHWLSAHLLRLERVAADQPHAIPTICGLLIRQQEKLSPLEHAYCLHRLLECLRADEIAPLVLEHVPLINSLEDMAVISSETIATLQKLVKNQEFSSRAIRVAALLSLNHVDAEKILISLLEQRQVQIDQSSLTLCVNALSLLVLERADAILFEQLLQLLVNHPNAARVLPVFCANLGMIVRLGFHSQLVDSLMIAQSKVKGANALNDLKWQLCAISARESMLPSWRRLSEKFHSARDEFFESFSVRLSAQFPLPGFPITQWNSLPFQEQQQQTALCTEEAFNDTYMETDGAILSLDKNNQQTLWSRTCIGKHAYQIELLSLEEEQQSPVDELLKSLSESDNFSTNFTASARKKSSPIEDIFDPFQELPFPSARSYSFSSTKQQELVPLDISVPEMLQFIQSSSRSPIDEMEENTQSHYLDGQQSELCYDRDKFNWRQFTSSLGLLELAKDSPNNFQRDLRHLDSTICREVHKVAVIFVGRDQQDKQAILSNTDGSDGFNKFVDGLGWPVQIGSPDFFGYTGGLPNGQLAPYFATANTELIFHVSTLLNGDCTQRFKHLGNDEVHVVWSENTKPYRRDLIATRFCDVLIVLYVVSPVLLRVHIEVQDQRLQFGPLFDGACVHTLQAASLVRETVLNASRAYRNLRVECDRPNKHREKVFRDTKQLLKHLPLSAAITRLFAPNTQ